MAEPSPGDVHAYGKARIGAERDALLALLAEDVIHADEEIVSFGVDVEHPSEARREAVYRQVDTAVKPAERFPVGTQAPFRPRVRAVDARAAQEAERDWPVYRQVIAASKVERRANPGGAATLVALVLEVAKSVSWSP